MSLWRFLQTLSTYQRTTCHGTLEREDSCFKDSFIMSEAPKAYREGLLAALSLRRACDNHGTIARWVLVFVIR